MDQKERRALDKCFESFLRDLDPTTSFIHSLYAEGVLTEEQVDRISKTTSRETQVALLLRFLPHRGPNAFTIFKDKLEKDYKWLAKKLDDELRKMQSVGSNQQCPIHKLIEDKLKTEKQRSVDSNLDDLNKEVKDLKKQLREMLKLKGENERLKNIVEKQKEKLRDYNKMVRETKKYKSDMERHKKEAVALKLEIELLKDQLQSNLCKKQQYDNREAAKNDVYVIFSHVTSMDKGSAKSG
ncbi:CRADD-like protein [Mya arenaria]|uniref:CRADD-like protein n=1 Tax=Mya arenaria TaxID=6604 RepID=A0ABY7F6B8_MYAAR|nr:CRADD-like protein [Mya arenaria]